MPLITLFSAPKPFTNPHIAMIQRNAIKSWTLLPDVEVILLGEEEGLAEAAKELGVKHISQVARNANGTPLISSMFKLARENSSSDLLCIINADMILMPDFVECAMESDSLLSKKREQAPALQKKFVLLSQRWDYDITAPLDFAGGWESHGLRSICQKTESASPSGGKRFLPLPKKFLSRYPRFYYWPRRLG